MDSKIKIVIIAKNNERVSDSILKIIDEDNVAENIKEIIKANKIVLIEKFLIKMDKKKIVNTAIGFSKNKAIHSLRVSNYNNELYMGGVVGVIEDELKINLKDEEFWVSESDRLLENNEWVTLDIRLQIQSRFDTEKPYFLATMLLRDKIKLNDNMVLSSEEDLYDYMLLFWYKTKLVEAYEKGFYKTYRRFETNGERLKGAIDISRHIRLNVGQNNGKIAYSYRENTINNYLNHLIIVAYEYMKKKYPELVEQNIDADLELKNIIESIKYEIGYQPLESKRLIKENNRPISHPYFFEYEDLRMICIKILRDEGISIWDTEEEKSKSILFYIPDLWELYLEDKIKEREEIGKDIKTQGNNPFGESVRVFGNLTAKENKEFSKQTFPDFVFFDENHPYFVLDAKFRKGWSSSITIKENGKGIIEELGDYDKCIRDMNSLNAHATGVIFPTNELQDDRFNEESMTHKISQFNQQDVFYTFPIVIPSVIISSDKSNEKETIKYTTWKKMFDDNVDKTLKVVENKVCLEKQYAKNVRNHMKDFPQRNQKGE